MADTIRRRNDGGTLEGRFGALHGVMLDGRAQASGIKRRGSDATVLIVFNSHTDVVDFTLPEVVGGDYWELLVDTNIPVLPEQKPFEFGQRYRVTARSLLLFARESGESAGRVMLAQEALRRASLQNFVLPQRNKA